MNLFFTRGNDAISGVWKQLPLSPEDAGELYAALDNINLQDLKTVISDVETSVPNLKECLFRKCIGVDVSIKELNFLAERIQSLPDQQQDIFNAVLEIETVKSIQDVINLSCNLDKYELFEDIVSETELGKYLLRKEGVTVPYELERYVDYEKVGIIFCDEHKGAFSDYGFVVRSLPLEQIYDGSNFPPVAEKLDVERKAELFDNMIRGLEGLFPDQDLYELLRDSFQMTDCEIKKSGIEFADNDWKEYTTLLSEMSGVTVKRDYTPTEKIKLKDIIRVMLPGNTYLEHDIVDIGFIPASGLSSSDLPLNA